MAAKKSSGRKDGKKSSSGKARQAGVKKLQQADAKKQAESKAVGSKRTSY